MVLKTKPPNSGTSTFLPAQDIFLYIQKISVAFPSKQLCKKNIQHDPHYKKNWINQRNLPRESLPPEKLSHTSGNRPRYRVTGVLRLPTAVPSLIILGQYYRQISYTISDTNYAGKVSRINTLRTEGLIVDGAKIPRLYFCWYLLAEIASVIRRNPNDRNSGFRARASINNFNNGRADEERGGQAGPFLHFLLDFFLLGPLVPCPPGLGGRASGVLSSGRITTPGTLAMVSGRESGLMRPSGPSEKDPWCPGGIGGLGRPGGGLRDAATYTPLGGLLGFPRGGFSSLLGFPRMLISIGTYVETRSMLVRSDLLSSLHVFWRSDRILDRGGAQDFLCVYGLEILDLGTWFPW
ncbi:hypothetical protein ACFE04_004250 [Oxalis oulophora]